MIESHCIVHRKTNISMMSILNECLWVWFVGKILHSFIKYHFSRQKHHHFSFENSFPFILLRIIRAHSMILCIANRIDHHTKLLPISNVVWRRGFLFCNRNCESQMSRTHARAHALLFHTVREKNVPFTATAFQCTVDDVILLNAWRMDII